MQAAQKINDKLGNKQFDDYNSFVPLLNKTIKELKLDIDAKELKAITDAICWKNEDAERVIKKTEKDGTVTYEADSDFLHGKWQACRYFYLYELPKVDATLQLLATVDTTTLDMRSNWF